MNPIGNPDIRIRFKKADSSSKKFAFEKANELNNIEKLTKVECGHCNGHGHHFTRNGKSKCLRCNGYGHYYVKNKWRVGKNTDKQLIVETDNQDVHNLKLIIDNLRKIFRYDFSTIKTLHGYHIIGTHRYQSLEAWEHANCLVLNNHVKYGEYRRYKEMILSLDKELREYQNCGNYKSLFTTSVQNKRLLKCVGDFDILYTVLSLKYGKSTLRISKKSDNDKYELVNHEQS